MMKYTVIVTLLWDVRANLIWIFPPHQKLSVRRKNPYSGLFLGHRHQKKAVWLNQTKTRSANGEPVFIIRVMGLSQKYFGQPHSFSSYMTVMVDSQPSPGAVSK